MQKNKPFADIKHLFEPKSIAVIGASSNSKKIGFKVVDNIKHSGYQGSVLPINPKGGEILGYKVYRAIEDLDEDIDIATICVPAKYVFDTIVACSKKNTKFISIITSGFSEIGNINEEKELVEFARNNGMRILGPNIFGI
ncbi:MAG: CoA-binding protein, partial [Candidatus Hodarchaeales archaeon]